MKTKFLFHLLIASFLVLKTSAQIVDPSISSNYSPEIVSRVYQVVVKTNINSIKQNAIAAIFKTQDEQVAQMISQNQTQRNIDSVYNLYQNSWKSILSSTDQFYYSSELYQEGKLLRYSYPFLLTAIKYQNEIGFGNTVNNYLLARVDSLKIQEENFILQNPNQLFNSYSAQNYYINSILSDSQYIKLVRIYNDKKFQANAKRDWEDLVTRGLAEGYSAETTLQQFYDFYVKKEFAYGRYQRNETAKRNYLQRLYDTEFEAGRKLYYARKYNNAGKNNKPSDFSQFLFAIKNTNPLYLSAEQVKFILEKADSLEVLKETAYLADSTKPYDGRAYEASRLKLILQNGQYSTFLSLKNQGRAKMYASNDWGELTQRNMIEGHNRDSTINELTQFYLIRQNIFDYYADDVKFQGELLAEINGNKPKALIALINARKNPDNNTSNW